MQLLTVHDNVINKTTRCSFKSSTNIKVTKDILICARVYYVNTSDYQQISSTPNNQMMITITITDYVSTQNETEKMNEYDSKKS